MLEGIKNIFRHAVIGSEAERWLREEKIPYKKNILKNEIFVPGSIHITGRGLTSLPDLSNVTLGGGFNCSHNRLTSLKGSPAEVGFYSRSQGTNGDFNCSDNQLTSLEYSTTKVARSYICSNNKLTSLKGSPRHINNTTYDESFSDYMEPIPDPSKDMMPAILGEPYMDCRNNQLVSLADAPETFPELLSDFGKFRQLKREPGSYSKDTPDNPIPAELRRTQEIQMSPNDSPKIAAHQKLI